MALPKVKHTQYSTDLSERLPDVKYRPFTHAEQKVIMEAVQSDDARTLLDNIINVLTAVTYGCLDVSSLYAHEFNKLVLAVRSKAVGEIVVATAKCPSCNEQNKLKLNLLEDVVVTSNSLDNKIPVGDMVLVMKTPTIGDVVKHTSNEPTDTDAFRMVVDSIVDGDDIYNICDESNEEIDMFKADLEISALKAIEEYQKSAPTTVLSKEYTCNKCNNTHKIEVKDFNHFLA